MPIEKVRPKPHQCCCTYLEVGVKLAGNVLNAVELLHDHLGADASVRSRVLVVVVKVDDRTTNPNMRHCYQVAHAKNV